MKNFLNQKDSIIFVMKLKKYVLGFIGNDESNFLEYGSNSHYKSLMNFLESIEIYQLKEGIDLKEKRRLPEELISNWDILYHYEFIDMLITFILENGFPNALTLGFTSGVWSANGTNSKKFISKGFNPSIDILKSDEMEIVKVLIGAENFINLILFWNASLNNNLIWGVISEVKFNKKPNFDNFIKMNKIMFQEDKDLLRCDPVGININDVLDLIFPEEIPNHLKPPRRFRKVSIQIRKMIQTHLKFQDKYPYVYESICQPPAKPYGKENLKLVTPSGSVVKFVLTCIYKVIPIDIFGSERNRTIICKRIPIYFGKNMHKLLKLDDIIKNVKINDIKWVKPINDIKMTKPEFIRGKLLFSKFIKWLFEQFICKLLASFFHVTVPAKGSKLLFYPNNIWNHITKRYKSKYYNDKLIKVESNNGLKSFGLNDDHVGKLMILPKPTDFRLIVKPFKGNNQERITYMMYRKKVIRPINAILRALRGTSKEVLCESVDEVVMEVINFKREVNKQDKYYSIKFDIKEAYDSLSHLQIEKVLQHKLERYTKNDKIYVQYKSVIENGVKLGRQKLKVVDDINKLKEFESSKYLILDKHETFKFSKKEILEIVRSQYSKTSFIKFNKMGKFTYRRKVGVFQGFPISGVLFNVIYDSVMETLRKHIESKIFGSEKFKIIRLVDDFLVLSTHEKTIKVVRKLISRDIEPFKVKVNRQKTKVSDTQIEFVGLNIDLTELTCTKQMSQYNVDPIRCLNVKKLMMMLTNYLDSRLGCSMGTLFSIENSGYEVAKGNIISLVKAILWKFLNSWTSPLEKQVFDKWTMQLFNKVNWILTNGEFNDVVLSVCTLSYCSHVMHLRRSTER